MAWHRPARARHLVACLFAVSVLVSCAQPPRDDDDDIIPFLVVYIFGDSSSDVGNTFNITHGESPPLRLYPLQGRFSNGPVFPEYVVEMISEQENHPVEARNYAWGGATSSNSVIPGISGPQDIIVPGVDEQIEAALDEHHSSDGTEAFGSDALVVYQAGINDYNQLMLAGRLTSVAQAVGLVIASVEQNLKDILVGQPKEIAVTSFIPFSKNPYVHKLPALSAGQVEAVERAHNEALAGVVAGLQDSPAGNNTRITLVNMYDVVLRLIANGTEYGILNERDACVDEMKGTRCDDPDTHLWYDQVHVTTVVHEFIAEQVVAAVMGKYNQYSAYSNRS